MRCDAWACCQDEAASHQLPITAAFWISWKVSMQECSSLMQNLMQIHCSTCSVILNVRATKYTCSLNGVYHPHWLVQWSGHCSFMCIPVHSPWLPGYIDVTNHSHHVNNGWTFPRQNLYMRTGGTVFLQWLSSLNSFQNAQIHMVIYHQKLFLML